MTVEGLEEPCPACGRTSGDHTLREWSECVGTVTTDLPYEETPADAAAVTAAAIRERFGLDPDLIVSDHAVVRAATLDGASGLVRVRVPIVLFEFQIGVPGGPDTVAKVAYLAGSGPGIRTFGKLVRDTANGAANAAAADG